jgi:hypothetical protein
MQFDKVVKLYKKYSSSVPREWSVNAVKKKEIGRCKKQSFYILPLSPILNPV